MTVIMAHAIPWLQPRGGNLNQTTTKHMGFLSVACKCNRSNAKHDTNCESAVFFDYPIRIILMRDNLDLMWKNHIYLMLTIQVCKIRTE